MFISRSLSISYATVSEAGDKGHNEDSILALEQDGRYCFVVADGLGGSGLGYVASKKLRDVFELEFAEATDNRSFLAKAVERAQQEIRAEQLAIRAPNQMKTTVVALSIIRGRCAWAHVGDSRLYRFRRGGFVSRTLDHSVPQMLARAGEITDSEIASHPDRARLLCAVGDNWDRPRYEVSKNIALRRDTAFLLCSDGFWELLPTAMLAPQPGSDADAWLSAMMHEFGNAGGDDCDKDDYSAIAVVVK